MVLVLKNDQMKDLLPMGEEIDAHLARPFVSSASKLPECATRPAENPTKGRGRTIAISQHHGAVPGSSHVALRNDSFLKEVQIAG